MTSPNYAELFCILFVGALQPLTEIFFGPRLAAFYNIAAAVLVVSYVLYLLVHKPLLLGAWGIRFDNLKSSVPAYLVFTLIAGVFIYIIGAYLGHTPLLVSFWYLVAFYPIWGLAQQFVLQNFVADNLTGVFPDIFIRAIVVAGIFSLSHAPSLELMAVTALAGFFFTILYYRVPNLIALGCSHGFLGALIFYLILGQDQWTILQQYWQ